MKSSGGEKGYKLRYEVSPQPLLTLKETAEYLRLTPGALYTQRYRGEKPGVLGMRVGRKILFRRSDIDRFLDELSESAPDFERWR